MFYLDKKFLKRILWYREIDLVELFHRLHYKFEWWLINLGVLTLYILPCL